MSTDEAALGIGVLRDSGCCLRPPAKAGDMNFGGKDRQQGLPHRLH